MDNEAALNEPLLMVCSGSTYYTQDKQVKRNILGMFQNKRTTNLVNFSKRFPITSAQETLEIEIVNFHNQRLDISCLAVFHLDGSVRSMLLTN